MAEGPKRRSYVVTVEQDGDDLILPFPEELLEETGWQEGDTLIWKQIEGGYELTKQ